MCMYVHIYVYMYMHVCTHIYIYRDAYTCYRVVGPPQVCVMKGPSQEL